MEKGVGTSAWVRRIADSGIPGKGVAQGAVGFGQGLGPQVANPRWHGCEEQVFGARVFGVGVRGHEGCGSDEKEAWRMEGVHERWQESARSRTVVPQGSEVGEASGGGSAYLDAGDESVGPRPPLSPLGLDTVLTVEDLRRLLKLVVYS